MLNWSHFTFRQKLKHKAKEFGVVVHEVSEHYSSKGCGQCGMIHCNLKGSKTFIGFYIFAQKCIGLVLAGLKGKTLQTALHQNVKPFEMKFKSKRRKRQESFFIRYKDWN
jgi:hypothetical protein